MKKYFWWKKSTTILILIFIIVISCISTRDFPSQNMRIEVNFNDVADNLVTQCYFDLGDGYSEENSRSGVVTNNKVVIDIPRKYYKPIKIRFDPINSSKNTIITNIKIFNYDKEVLNWAGKDIVKYVESTNNIKEMQVIDNSLKIIPENEDVITIFNNDAIKEFQAAANYDFNKKAVLLAISTIIFLVILFREHLNRIVEKIISKYLSNNTKFKSTIIFSIIVIPAIYLYWKYIAFEKIYIFNDIASDSYYQTFPSIIYNAKYIHDFHLFPKWSFNFGLGQNIFTQLLDPFNLLLSLFGENLVPYLLGVFQCIKVILAGGLFYKYLRTMSISRYVSIISAIGYAYCGHIIVRASWISYPNEVVCVAFLLFSFELFYKKNNFKLLPIAVALIIITLKGYFFLLYSGILIGYAVFRYISENEFSLKPFIKYISTVLMLYIIGVLLSSIYLIPNLVLNFTGARVSSLKFDFKNLINSVFSINSNDILLTSYARTISDNVLGVSKYSGYANLLEAPTYYCGLITLILIPQIFVDLDKKKKICYSCALGIAIAYIISPGIRFIAGGMVTMEFKVSSFWIMVLFLYLSSHSFNEIILGKKINTKLLVVTIISILCPMGILFLTKYKALEINEAIIVIFFILLYFFLFLMLKKYKHFSKVLILALAIMESITFSYKVVNERGTISKNDLNNAGYYDSTSKVVKNINQQEKDNFYRISRNYNSVYFLDPQIQEYYGTQSYQGGSTQSKYIINFIDNINAPLLLSDRCIVGFSGYTQVNTMVGVKYILSKSDEISEYGYELAEKYDDVTVLRNKYSLPLGYAYNNYITYDEFEKLTTDQKKDILLKACVLNSDSKMINKLDISNYEDNKKKMIEDNILTKSKTYTNAEETIISSKEENDLITVSFDISKNSDESALENNKLTGKIYWAGDGKDFNINNTITFGVNSNNTNHLFEINQKNIKRIKIVMDNMDDKNNIKISNLKISNPVAENYYEEYRNNISELKKNELNITSFNQSNIQGNIELNKSKMMFFSIPYDKGWTLKVDGNPVELENVNVGFMGAYITEGYHNIDLNYTPPMLNISIALLMFGIVAYIIMMITIKKKKEAL